jgi:hypothetical protein
MFYGSGLGVALACMSPSQAEPTSASTAETQLDDNQGLAEIIVTANKREESIDKVGLHAGFPATYGITFSARFR